MQHFHITITDYKLITPFSYAKLRPEFIALSLFMLE